MKSITMFTFGYDGWGNATPQLVQAVDAVERSRGFKPPIFVDIRIRRSVRAEGFKGSNFEKLLGEKRHHWMKSLGNKRIITRTGPPIQIADPSSAAELLDLALNAANDSRRVIFFCSCPFPRFEGKISCHRTTVGTLLLSAAKRHGSSVEVVEWPGDKPRQISIEVKSNRLSAINNGRMYIPLAGDGDVDKFAGLPWGSIATLRCNNEKIHRIVGPAIYRSGKWLLPVLQFFYDPSVSLGKYREESIRAVKLFGLDPREQLGH